MKIRAWPRYEPSPQNLFISSLKQSTMLCSHWAFQSCFLVSLVLCSITPYLQLVKNSNSAEVKTKRDAMWIMPKIDSQARVFKGKKKNVSVFHLVVCVCLQLQTDFACPLTWLQVYAGSGGPGEICSHPDCCCFFDRYHRSIDRPWRISGAGGHCQQQHRCESEHWEVFFILQSSNQFGQIFSSDDLGPNRVRNRSKMDQNSQEQFVLLLRLNILQANRKVG